MMELTSPERLVDELAVLLIVFDSCAGYTEANPSRHSEREVPFSAKLLCYDEKENDMPNALTDFSNDLSSAVEKAGASTILVDARKRYPASGIAFAEDLILTADHVVTKEDIKVGLHDGKTLSATVAGRDPGSDLALLRLAEKALSPAKTSDDVKV